MKYKGILFDKDGTLLDFNKTWIPIYRIAAQEFADGDAVLENQLLEHHGFDATQKRFIGGSLLAAGNNHEIAHAWAIQTGQPEQTDQISDRLNDIFSEGAKQAVFG